MSIKRAVFFVATEQLGAEEEELSVETLIFDDLGADESDFSDFIAALEDALEVEVELDAQSGFETLGDVIDYFESQ